MGQSPTALGWPYPLSSPSQRFTQMNNFVRQLDNRFNALSDGEKSEWNAAVAETGYWGICDWWLWMIPISPEFAATGIQCYRTINCNRLVLGLTVIDSPPPVTILVGPDSIVKDGSTPRTIRWFRAGGDPGFAAAAFVRGVGLNHQPESGPAGQKFKWNSARALPYNTGIDVSAAIMAASGNGTLGAVVLGVQLVCATGAPFGGGQVRYSKPYVD